MDDYETGLHRGRATRHTLGRLRWLLIASLLINLFLFYKVWDYRSQIFEFQSNIEMMQKSVAEKNLKAHDLISVLHKEKEKYSKLQALSKDLLSECEINRKQCAQDLISTSTKLTDVSNTLHNLEDEKDQVNAQLEKCEGELTELREFAGKLQTDIAKEERKNEALTDKAVDLQTNVNIPAETIQEIKGPETNSNQSLSMKVDENKDDNTRALGEETELSSFISCLFNEDLSGQKCSYHNDPEAPSWKLGHAEFLNRAGSDQDAKDVLCVYVDDSMLSPESSTGIVFDSFVSNHCLEVSLTFMLLESGAIVIEDNEQSYEIVSSAEKSGWRTEKFPFKQSPSHLLKFTGKVSSKSGAAAIASIAVTEAQCSVTVVDNGAHEVGNNDEDDDDDQLLDIMR